VKALNCCRRKTTDCFHETNDCFTSGNIVLKLFEFLCMGTVVSFLSKAVMGQNYIYCGFEYNLIGSYSGHNGIYFMTSWKIKSSYGWSNLDCAVTDNSFSTRKQPTKCQYMLTAFSAYIHVLVQLFFFHKINSLCFLCLYLLGSLSSLKNYHCIMDSTPPS